MKLRIVDNTNEATRILNQLFDSCGYISIVELGGNRIGDAAGKWYLEFDEVGTLVRYFMTFTDGSGIDCENVEGANNTYNIIRTIEYIARYGY